MMMHLTQADDLACRLLKFEQQLLSYEKLHSTELAELWQTLNDCKQMIAAFIPPNGSDGSDESNNAEADERSLASTATDIHA